MSIVIKGVNAPNNCYDCINSSDGKPFELLSNCRTFGDLCEGKITVDELPKDKRSDSCPVKQLPTPHGRLIDADRLLALVEKEINNTCIGCEPEPDDCCAYDRFEKIISEIKTAQTIIETEA